MPVPPTVPPVAGLADIASPSNFITDYIEIDPLTPCLDLQGEGKLRFLCNPSHISYDDPILYPGQQGAAHLHHFFGNTAADRNSTYASLRSTGDSTCAGRGLNRTGYWFPAMIKPAGPGFPVAKVVVPEFIELYYAIAEAGDLDDYASPVGHTTYGMVPFPNGLQMIWGWKHTHPILPPSSFIDGGVTGNGAWVSDHPSYVGGYKNTIAEVLSSSPGILTPPWGRIGARFASPDCWDGANLSSVDGRSHLAYGYQDGSGRLICPATHKYRIPVVLLIVMWPAVDPQDWKNWFISVDRHTGHNLAGGHGMHTDWLGAWDSGIKTIWEQEHLAIGKTAAAGAAAGGMKTANAGALCRDNWRLTDDHLFYGAANNYLDIPAKAGEKRLRLNLTAA